MTGSWDQNWEKGRHGEDLVRRLLKRDGRLLLPATDFNGRGAPMLEGENESDILPDFLAAHRGAVEFWEVKTKTERTLHRNSTTWETGFSHRHWSHYTRVQEQTGAAVWVVFIHVKQDEVVFQKLEIINRCSRVAKDEGTLAAYRGEAMVFVDCSCLLQWARLSELGDDSRLVVEACRAQPMDPAKAAKLVASVFPTASTDVDDDEMRAEFERRGAMVTPSGAIITARDQNVAAFRQKAHAWFQRNPRELARRKGEAAE